APQPPAPPGRFGRFTVALYNKTVDDLRRRHRIVAPLTVLLSIAIGITVVAVTLLYGAYGSPLWIALLPTVWLIPVPFFALAFRGTQRMLSRDHLRLPDEP
ncbi:MAG: hypothetical protein L3J97_06025, partial [Thermoplasmata archaeon]|nr:hypothetical protein [Thermoplasmata archaeon]